MDVTNRTLFVITAVVEVWAGVALLVWPVGVVPLLIGGTFDTPAEHTVGRIAGTALFALGVACWTARDDGRSRAAVGILRAMVQYNTGVAVSLVWAAGLGRDGIVLWPAVVLHAFMCGWCLACLRGGRNPSTSAGNSTVTAAPN